MSEQNLANALDGFSSEHESSYVSGAEIVVDGGLTAHGGAKGRSDVLQPKTR